MRFVLGFASGVAAAWAALAIWQRVPPLGSVDFEPDGDPDVSDGVWEPRRGDRRPGFDASVAAWPPPPVTDPAAHRHDRYCRYPSRPCVCSVMHPVGGGFGSP